jgi:pimeloyl-ACP methyl ester carboxylesterase
VSTSSRPLPSRRDMFKAVGCVPIAAPRRLWSLVQSKQRIFVLVHAAWHGAWCWKKVVPLLQQRGHHVVTPTLTGLGERSHLARPDTGLDVHVSDIVNVLTFEDLHEVVLVGHSSAGVVITGVASRAPRHVAHLVYLDAFVPEDGQSVLDLVATDRRRTMEALVNTEGDGWRLPRLAPPPWETIVRDMWGVTDDGDVRWLLERLRATPFGHFKDPVHRTRPAAEELPRTYVRCRRYQSARFDQHAEMAQRTAGWRHRELTASHHPAITAPGDLAELLLEVSS